MITQLEISWPSLTTRESEYFWKSEWKKHGTCSYLYNGITQPEYFQMALRIWTESDLYRTLKTSGNLPRPRVPFKVVDFVKIIQTHNPGYNVELQCLNGELYQIFLCFDVLGNKPQRCPSQGNCGDDFIWKGW